MWNLTNETGSCEDHWKLVGTQLHETDVVWAPYGATNNLLQSMQKRWNIRTSCLVSACFLSFVELVHHILWYTVYTCITTALYFIKRPLVGQELNMLEPYPVACALFVRPFLLACAISAAWSEVDGAGKVKFWYMASMTRHDDTCAR